MSKKSKRFNPTSPQGANMAIQDQDQKADDQINQLDDTHQEVKGDAEDVKNDTDTPVELDPTLIPKSWPAADPVATPVEEKEPAPVIEQPVVEVKIAAPVVQETQEVKPVMAVAPAAPVVQEEVKQTFSQTVKTEAPAAVITTLDQLKQKIHETGTPEAKKLVEALENYIGAMRPGLAITSEKGNMQQSALWFTLKGLVDGANPELFRSLWHIVLMYFKTHKNGALSARHVFRFSESWTRDLEHLKGFQNLLNLIRLTADPEEREDGLRQVDIANSLKYGFTENGRSRLVQYYKG